MSHVMSWPTATKEESRTCGLCGKPIQPGERHNVIRIEDGVEFVEYYACEDDITKLKVKQSPAHSDE